jgi:hypothetical protein
VGSKTELFPSSSLAPGYHYHEEGQKGNDAYLVCLMSDATDVEDDAIFGVQIHSFDLLPLIRYTIVTREMILNDDR